MRVVFDTNVLVAAFATHGLCHSLFEICLQEHELVASDDILAEVEQELRQKIKVPAPAVRDIVSYLGKHCLMDRPVPIPAAACRDPKDLAVIGLAAAAHAECLISGDKDILVLKRYHETEILSPRQLYDRLRRRQGAETPLVE